LVTRIKKPMLNHGLNGTCWHVNQNTFY